MSDPPSPVEALSVDSNIVASDSISYWNAVSADVNGMLGGFPQVSRIDLQGSRNFIAKVRRSNAKASMAATAVTTTTATTSNHTDTPPTSSSPSSDYPPPTKKLRLTVDCGAGIGRITTGLLTQVSEVVDIVEPVSKFAKVLQSHPLRSSGAIGSIYVEGLEVWRPSKRYDLIWNQWCVGHLTDAQLVAYLRRAGDALAPDGGWLAVKENLSTDSFGEDIFDDVDSSVTRSDAKFKRLFDEAGLEVLRAELQTGFPKGLGLYPVKMYALRPR